ncbi:hypothetical protein KY382_28965 [Pseudomonas monteilii]|nr:hypothetical protein [Enterococcus innesii]MCT8192175.1 hypothetical protein [Pseudomonas monteilii]
MTDYEKLVLLLNGRFREIKFSRIKKLENGTFHLVDRTGQLWVRFNGDQAQISFQKDFLTIFDEFDIYSETSNMIWIPGKFEASSPQMLDGE